MSSPLHICTTNFPQGILEIKNTAHSRFRIFLRPATPRLVPAQCPTRGGDKPRHYINLRVRFLPQSNSVGAGLVPARFPHQAGINPATTPNSPGTGAALSHPLHGTIGSWACQLMHDANGSAPGCRQQIADKAKYQPRSDRDSNTASREGISSFAFFRRGGACPRPSPPTRRG